MNAKQYLEQQAAAAGFTSSESFHDDVDLRPAPGLSGIELLEFCAKLSEAGYILSFCKDRRITVKAPHYKKHDWDNHKGWHCTHGLTVKGCEVFTAPNIGSVI